MFLLYSLQIVKLGFLSQFQIYVKHYISSIGKISKDTSVLELIELTAKVTSCIIQRCDAYKYNQQQSKAKSSNNALCTLIIVSMNDHI